MCGRYAIYTAPHKLADLFGLTGFPAAMPQFGPRYNAAPLQSLPLIVHNRLGMARWGLRPPWAQHDDTGLCAKMINARSETVADKPAFADAWDKRRRCLIPADGFYEWVTDGTGARNPYFLRRADENIMAFAGLWAKHGDLVTFTILTKDAAAPLDDIHHRMPVILAPDRAGDWFTADDAGARRLIAEAGASGMTYHPVDTAVGKVANDSAALIEARAKATLF